MNKENFDNVKAIIEIEMDKITSFKSAYLKGMITGGELSEATKNEFIIIKALIEQIENDCNGVYF